MESLKVLKLYQEKFPNVQAAATELINLNAILHLPKGTESFIADIHGEYDAFNHLLKNTSGIIKQKIDLRFQEKTVLEKNRLAFFIYYPTDMMRKYQKRLSHEDYETLLRTIIHDMVSLARLIVIKYTQSKVRKNLPKEFAYILNELLYESRSHDDKKEYYEAILNALFETKREQRLILELSRVIRKLSIDQLHIVGDIFDRGPSPQRVMEKLTTLKYVDIQWGNHDIIWIGAASGSLVSIANVIRIAARYGHLDALEDGYGINLRPLASLASTLYKNDNASVFKPVPKETGGLDDETLLSRMHKAITLIQFKLEHAIIKRHPEYEMDDRLLLDKIKEGSVLLDKPYPLKDDYLPSIDPNHPYELSDGEAQVMEHLRQVFIHNELLQRHIKYLLEKGSLYLKTNDNLLFHANIPVHEDGTFMSIKLEDKKVFGKSLFETMERLIRKAFLNRYETDDSLQDIFLFAWQGKASPLFGKDAMKTFERYFIEDKKTHQETLNPYFKLRHQEAFVKQCLIEFGCDPDKAKIINGHVPLDITKGEDVVLAGKKVFLIDGGMSKEYKTKTRVGGYTLISDSYAYYLVAHSRFENYKTLIENEEDIISLTHSEDLRSRRSFVYDTDIGTSLNDTIEDLKALIDAYRTGLLKESFKEKEGAKNL